MDKLIHWLITLGLGYLALLVLVWALQGCMVHLPQSRLVATPAEAGLDYEEVRLDTDDGETLHGWFLPAPRERAVVLFFHGNAGNISHRLESLEIFHELGLSVLIVDYRGYGESSGRPSEQGLYRDARAAYRYLIDERDVAPQRVIAFGRSLGAAVAAKLASEREVGALWLESAFTSVPDIGSDLYPFLPVRWLSRYRYDSLKALESVEAPVLVVHSPDDDIIPYEHGRALFEAASEPKQFLKIEGSHNAGFMRSRGHYKAGLEQFLTRFFSDE